MTIDRATIRELERQRAHGACDYADYGGLFAPAHDEASGTLLVSPSGRTRRVAVGFDERTEPPVAEEVTLAPVIGAAQANRWLRTHHELVDFENVWLRRATEPIDAPSSTVGTTMEMVDDAQGAVWPGLVADPPRLQLLVAVVNGVVAGRGGLVIRGSVATVFGGATVERLRRRGVQAALLAERCRRARDAGVSWLVGITEPGDGSERNLERLGFELVYTALVLRRTQAAPR